MFVSSDPIEVEDLRRTFNRTEKLARTELNLKTAPLEFDEQIKVLEELFILSRQNPYTDEIWLEFRSPGIKDYLLEYLRKYIGVWGEVLLKGAMFFNQLCYVFSTFEEEISDVSTDISLFGEKIILSRELQEVLKKKILSEFDLLNFSTDDFNEVADMLTREHNSLDTEYVKYILLMRLFNIGEKENIEVRDFIVERVRKQLRSFDGTRKVVSKDSMLRFPGVIEALKPYLELNPVWILTIFHYSITFAEEYHYFYSFKRIYPEEFEAYYHKHIGRIRRHLRGLILKDIDYYGWDDGIGPELDRLFWLIDDLKRQYGIRLNKEFIREMEDRLGLSGFWKDRNSSLACKPRKRKEEPEKYKPSFSDQMVAAYLGSKYDSGVDPGEYIRGYCSDKQVKKRLLQELGKEGSVIRGFIDNIPSLTEMIDFVCADDLEFERLSAYSFLDCFVGYCCRKYKIDRKLVGEVLPKMALECYYKDVHSRDSVYYTDTRMKEWLECSGMEPPDPDVLYPLVIREKNWYTFLNFDLMLYLITQALKQERDTKKYKETVMDICASGEQLFGAFIREADPGRFCEEILRPEMKRFLEALDPVSPRALTMSFLRFFNPTVDLEWQKRKQTFEEVGGGSKECIIQELLCTLGIISEFYEWEVGLFCLREAYRKENIEIYKMRPEGYPELYYKLLQTIGLLDEKGNPVKSTDKRLELNIYKFASDEENYRVLQNVGMEDFIVDLYARIKRKTDELF